jgi:hypothetical protein
MKITVFMFRGDPTAKKHIQALRFNGVGVNIVRMCKFSGPNWLTILAASAIGCCYAISNLWRARTILAYGSLATGVAAMFASMTSNSNYFVYGRAGERLTGITRLVEKHVLMNASGFASEESLPTMIDVRGERKFSDDMIAFMSCNEEVC